MDKLVTFYQIKLLEKRVDYNEFGDKSKIDLIMALPTAVCPMERLRKRMVALSLV